MPSPPIRGSARPTLFGCRRVGRWRQQVMASVHFRQVAPCTSLAMHLSIAGHVPPPPFSHQSLEQLSRHSACKETVESRTGSTRCKAV